MPYYLCMERLPVISTALSSVGYDLETRIMEVEIINGDIYQYLDVPEEIYQQLMAAESKGTYFNTVFKPLGFEYRKL
jgi:hypothetical protein